MLTDGDIARIAQRIATGYGPLVVATFGSYALGTAHAGSDLDVVIVKQTAEHASARRNAVRRLVFGVLHALDVHVFTPAEFEEAAHDPFSFTWVIARQARIYHWTAGAGRAVPSLAARAPREGA